MSFPFQYSSLSFASINRVIVDTSGPFSDVTDLKAYYKFEEAVGDTPPELKNQASLISPASTESLGTAADGTENGTLVSGVAGKIDNAWSFDQSASNYVELGTSTSQWNFLHNTSGHWTIAWWMKLNVSEPGFNGFIFGDADEAAANDIGFGIRFDDQPTKDHQLNVEIGNASANPSGTSTASFVPKDTTTFYHYIITGNYTTGPDQYNVEMYRDNANNESFTLSGTASNSNADNSSRIGINGRAIGNGVNAIIDELSIWDRVLTTDERAEIYNSGHGVEL